MSRNLNRLLNLRQACRKSTSRQGEYYNRKSLLDGVPIFLFLSRTVPEFTPCVWVKGQLQGVFAIASQVRILVECRDEKTNLAPIDSCGSAAPGGCLEKFALRKTWEPGKADGR